MKRIVPVVVVAAALAGYIAGRATQPSLQPVLSGHLNDFSLIQKAFAQKNGEVRPFGYDNPEDPPMAPDAPPPTHWNIDDIQKAHTELAARCMCRHAISACSCCIGYIEINLS